MIKDLKQNRHHPFLLKDDGDLHMLLLIISN